MDARLCKACRQPLRPGMAQCSNPKCLAWNVKTDTVNDIDASTVLLSDSTVGHVERIKTKLVDHVFGGGVVTTSVCLLAGEPGAGKTTLCLQLADIFAARSKREVLYIANEQDPVELKTTADRLELDNLKLIRVVKAMGGVNYDIGDLLLRFKPSAIFLDSVTKWAGEDLAMAVTICERLKEFTVKLNAPSIIINQINKGGDHAGLMKMQHAVDMTAVFAILENEGAPRQLFSTKNRFGPAPEEQFYVMTETGLVEIEDPDGEEEEEDSK